MLLFVLCLLPFVTAAYRDRYFFGKPANGKLVHDMRTFLNVTFDWSSRLHSTKGEVAIPKCHEQRLRESFYVLSDGSHVHFVKSNDFEMTPGYLVYPLATTVFGSPDLAKMGKFFPRETLNSHYALVHKFYEYQYVPTAEMEEDMKNNAVRLTFIPEETWTKIWDRWAEAARDGSDYCNGTTSFDDIIPEIFETEESLKKEYDMPSVEFYPYNSQYTDVTSDLCDHEGCVFPENQEETLFFAYPTEEGIAQLKKAAYFSKEDWPEFVVVDLTKQMSDGWMYQLVSKSYHGPTIMDHFMKSTNNKCVFTAPFC